METLTLPVTEVRACRTGGQVVRYYASLQYLDAGDPCSITMPAIEITQRMLERHAVRNSARRERAWSVLFSALVDALYPERDKRFTCHDQAAAFEWLRGEMCEEICEMLKIDHDWMLAIVGRLADV